MEPSFAVFLLLLVVGALVLARTRRKPDTDHLYVYGTPVQSLKVVLQHMVQNGYTVAYRDDTMATFTRSKKPDLDIAVLLLILGIVQVSYTSDYIRVRRRLPLCPLKMMVLPG